MKKYIKFILFCVLFITGNANAYIINHTFGLNSLPYLVSGTGSHADWSYGWYEINNWTSRNDAEWGGYWEDGFIVTSEYNNNNKLISSSLDVKIDGNSCVLECNPEEEFEFGYDFKVEIFPIDRVNEKTISYTIDNSTCGNSSCFVNVSIPFALELNVEYVIYSYIQVNSGSPHFIPETIPYFTGHHIEYIAEGFINIPKETPVPEPTTMLLFGTGLAGLAAFGRRKRS